jgi:rhodanese-related sulfurtransferase
MTALAKIDPNTARQWIERGEAVLVDIREPLERAREHIAETQSAPLSRIGAAAISAAGRKVIFHCRSGARTAANGATLGAICGGDAYVLEGGIEGWKAAGHPTVEDRNAPIDIMRQVQIVAGSLVVLGVVLAGLVSPWFVLLSGFVGAGLVFAGVSGFCGMARLLGAMPWNRLPAARAVYRP